MNFFKINKLAILLIFFGRLALYAQAPEQDCVNAIPVCQDSYSQQNSYSGSGNDPNEINPLNSCLGGGELNSVWYVMTIQADGMLNFSITPNDPNDDYDWAVFDLTSASCSDIYDDVSLEVSCNFSGNTGNNGITGPNGQTTGSGASQNEDEIPVQAGDIYYINVSNFSSTQSGYNLDLSASSAQVYDNVPPTIHDIPSQVVCGEDSITFNFSENILCSTIDVSDFALTGSGGPYTINSVSGVNCLSGSAYEKTYTVSISPAVNSGGTFNLRLVGSVTDLCGNQAVFPDSLPFAITSINLSADSSPDTCSMGVGTAAVITPGNGTYNYQWSPALGSDSLATGLSAGTYSVTVTDQSGGCPQQIDIVVENIPPPTAAFSVQPDHLTYLDATGYFTDESTGATQWEWSFGDTSSVSNEQNPSHLFPGPGDYTVQLVVSNDAGCTDTATADIAVTFLTTVYIPNAFTPAIGTGLNNEWGPVGEGIPADGYQLYVFDRWGQVVFESTNPTETWNGRDYKSKKKMPQGIYVYKLNIIDLNGEKREYLGHVTVLWR